MNTNTTIAFIGGGNMAASLIGGLISNGKAAETIRVSDTDPAKLKVLHNSLGVYTTTDNIDAVTNADIVVIAVKPQVLQSVATHLSSAVQSGKPLVISVAAGVRETDLNRWLGGGTAVIRCMPNTPSLIRSGASGLFANQAVTEQQRDQAENILRAVGLALWVKDESQLDAVTAVSGSGPAYFFLFMEAMEEAGCELGLDRETARLLTLQTGFGASKMALESDDSCAELRRRVTSPGGTTEQALNTFEGLELRAIVKKALTAASKRSSELADQLAQP